MRLIEVTSLPRCGFLLLMTRGVTDLISLTGYTAVRFTQLDLRLRSQLSFLATPIHN